MNLRQSAQLGDVDDNRDNIVHGSSDTGDDSADVFQHLSGLSDDIALAYHLAALVPRHLSGDMQGFAITLQGALGEDAEGHDHPRRIESICHAAPRAACTSVYRTDL